MRPAAPVAVLNSAGCDERAAARHVKQSAGVIGVEMREDDRLHIAGADPERAQPRTKLLFGMHGEVHRATEERIPAWVIAAFVDARGLAGVDEDESFVMFDEPDMDR
jgi:hypothetical protein